MESEIKIAYYRKTDWKKLLKAIDDPENMHENWKDWHKSFLKTKKELKTFGFKIKEMTIDINDLIEYCKKRNIQNTGQARSQYTSQL
jgi:peptidoglycan hydrolase CwlO-like protein